MYNRPMVPEAFSVPQRLDCGGYHLRMLSISDVDKDFEAVTASAEKLRGLLHPASTWPEGLTREEDLIDLAWHQREFTLRHSFAYTVMSDDETRCLGCIYIFPSNVTAFDAGVFYWTRTGVEAVVSDQSLGHLVKTWLNECWPFKSVAFPGREHAWSLWYPPLPV